MDDDFDRAPPGFPDPGPRRRIRHRKRDERRRHRREEQRDPGERDAPRKPRRELSAEERAYREAKRIANAKISFLLHFAAYGFTCLFLLFVAGFRAAFVVAMAWGIGLGLHYVAMLMAPQLRQRWIHQEVSRQVTHTTTRQRQELRGEHSRSLEELSASIAHEIRNPITAAKSLVQQMGEDPRAADNVEYAQVALDELDRVERSISHLLRFAREEDVALRPMQMADVVEAALETFRDRLEQLGVDVKRELDCDGEMKGDPDKLRRVLINLFGNALDAMQNAGTPSPRIQVQAGENLAGSEVWVRVRDNGPGIDPDRMQKVFSPFYTSKETGTGLGLAISKKVVDAHGGTIAADSAPGEGTEFLLTFPKHPHDNEESRA